MRILMMVHLFPPAGIGGAERQCFRQAQALVRRGHEVAIATPWWVGRCKRRETIDGVHVHRLGWLLPLTWQARRWHDRVKRPVPESGAPATAATAPARGKRFRWMSLAERPGLLSFLAETALAVKTGRLQADVVHVHESHWLAGFAHWVAEAMRVPVFCKEASAPVLRWGGAQDVPFAARWKERRNRCRFVAITPDIADLLRQQGIPADRIVQVSNGMELPADPAVPARHTRGLYVGNFSQGTHFKAFDVLIQAFGRAVRQEPGMRFRLHGRGDVSGWRNFAREQGCAAEMDFAGETNDVHGALRESGYFVLPSRVEGLSNALLEAMAMGLPAIVSDIPANRVAVRDRVEGLVVPVGDVEALAAALLALYRAADLRVRLGAAARRRVETEFEIGKVAEQLERMYQAAMSADVAQRKEQCRL